MLDELLVKAAQGSAGVGDGVFGVFENTTRDHSLHLERRLGITGDMRHYSLEYLGFISASCAQFDVEVLQLQFLPPEIIAKTSKLALLILLAILTVELMASDAFPHNLRVLFQTAAHGMRLRNVKAKTTMTSSGKYVVN